ncbi:MAG: hypothetical protein ACPG5L_16205 [Vibrio gallaecicus]
MRIETDRYLITKDDHNYILQMKEEIKDSRLLSDKSKIGSKKLGDKHFFTKMSHLFVRLVDLSITNDEEIDTMKKISYRVEQIGKELNEAI